MFLGKILLALRIYVIAVSPPLLPGLAPPPPTPISMECFSTPNYHYCRGQFPVMYSFPLRVYDWHGACLCPEMLGSSVMWWVYIFKKITPSTPHSSDYEPNSTLTFFFFFFLLLMMKMMMIICIIFFVLAHQCTVITTIIVGFHFYGYSFCVLHVVLKHFRVSPPPPSPLLLCLPPPPAEILWALLSSSSPFPVKVAIIENRHGTTHCLNTVDHRKWSRGDAPSCKRTGHYQTQLQQEAPHRPPRSRPLLSHRASLIWWQFCPRLFLFVSLSLPPPP